MIAERDLRNLWTSSLFIAICLGSIPTHAKYGGGSSTADDPYHIWTAEEMDEINFYWEDQGKHFKLMADIDLADYPADQYHSIDRFSGVFDGNGHTISHFTCTGGNNGVGLFGRVRDYVGGRNAVIKNLGLIDPNVHASQASGAGCLVGYLWEGAVKDCYVSGGSITAYGGSGAWWESIERG